MIRRNSAKKAGKTDSKSFRHLEKGEDSFREMSLFMTDIEIYSCFDFSMFCLAIRTFYSQTSLRMGSSLAKCNTERERE
jgi:hypothetical protein